jgi:Subtilase family
MKRHEGWMVSCAVLLGLSACSTLPRSTGPGDRNAVRNQASQEAAVSHQEAAVLNRWIGVTRTRLAGRPCPVPHTNGWTVRPLFPLENLNQNLQLAARRAGLHRFCVYEYGGNPPLPRVLPPEISARLRSAGPDRVALSGMASLEELTWNPFYERFRKQVQIPADLSVTDTSRVRLAFLDTQPTGSGLPERIARPDGAGPRSLHGYSLLHIAGRLIDYGIGGGSRVIETTSRLTLPLVSFDPGAGREEVRDETTGGFRGTFTDLATALVAEVHQWQETPDRPPHLVINLSLGWDGEKLGGWQTKVSRMPAEVQPIHAALTFAADLGVLVIAAAGNGLEGPDPTGLPLLPAGWELRSGEPLIYAVSGVDGQHRPLVNTRAEGEAPRVAYADHVAVPDRSGRYTATLTGTSVASAVVATTAAIVWSYRPDLSPAEVMAVLSRSGEPLLLPDGLRHRRHDFSTSPSAPQVRQITLCKAVLQACRESGAPPSRCPRPDCPDTESTGALDLGAFEAPVEGSLSVGRPFPREMYTDLREGAWIVPQPGTDPCPNCAVTDPVKRALSTTPHGIAVVADAAPRSHETGTRQLLIEIPHDWAAGSLSGATLELFDFDPATGRKRPLYGRSITPPLLSRGTALIVTFPAPPVPFQASLSFVLDPPEGAPPGTALSVVSPLFVD